MKTIKQIGLGTAMIGRPHYINIRQESPEAFNIEDFKTNAFQVLDKAYERGIRYFDTAPGYGIAEDFMLEWLDRKNDASIEIATKWGYTYTANFDLNASKHEVKEHSIDKLNEQWEKSKSFLPYLSTYQIHSATFESGVLKNDSVLNRLAELREKHNLKIGITVSGDQQKEILEDALLIIRDGQQLFEVYQVTYNILETSLRHIIDSLNQSSYRIVIKESLANGRLLPNKSFPKYLLLYELLENLAEKYDVGIDAIAMRYCIDTLNHPYSVLSGAAISNHLLENLSALRFNLLDSEIEKLKQFSIVRKEYWNERKEMVWN
ncbi:aldo/keto reductase [Reichenbachiella versicolor]|uniref:aldo/keto reductase n=1 Tax=Reichenbachiella versicolor TaxID=1821036 RepID=UPI000D6DD3BB|nr:aldo/keto reductase [Reichenbachiella versicolor]